MGAEAYEVYLWPQKEGRRPGSRIASTLRATLYPYSLPLDLIPETVYVWQIKAKNAGCSPPAFGALGEERIFKTRSIKLQRGDVDGMRGVNVADAMRILGFLFLGATDPGCKRSADVNDDGKVDITDPVALLGFLFLGTSPPPLPHGDCGFDGTSDELGCKASPCRA